MELTPELLRIAGLTPVESHREGIPVILALQARLALAKIDRARAAMFGEASYSAAAGRVGALMEALALIEPTATIGQRADTRPATGKSND